MHLPSQNNPVPKKVLGFLLKWERFMEYDEQPDWMSFRAGIETPQGIISLDWIAYQNYERRMANEKRLEKIGKGWIKGRL